MTDDLKPCPFCGAEAFIEGDDDPDAMGVDIGCSSERECPTHPSMFVDYHPNIDAEDIVASAIATWNRRASDESKPTRPRRLG